MEDRIADAIQYGYEIELVFVDTPLSICLWRNRLRGLNLTDQRVRAHCQKIKDRSLRKSGNRPKGGNRSRGNSEAIASSSDDGVEPESRRYSSTGRTRTGSGSGKSKNRSCSRDEASVPDDGYGAQEIRFHYGHHVPEEIILDKAQDINRSFRKLKANEDVHKVRVF